MYLQVPADQHNMPVVSHTETYALVPLHHRLSSLAPFCPSSASNCSVPPAARSLSSLRQPVPPTLQHKLQMLSHKHLLYVPFHPQRSCLFLPLPEWQLFPPGTSYPKLSSCPKPFHRGNNLLAKVVLFPPTTSGWLLLKWMNRDRTLKWAFRCLGGSAGDQTVPAEHVWVVGGRLQEACCAVIIPIPKVMVNQNPKTRLCCYMLAIAPMRIMHNMCVHMH